MKWEVKDPNTGVVTQANMKLRAVRLHHPTLRSCTYTVIDAGQKYPRQGGWPCPACGVTHEYKTFHLHLNQDGDVTVSEEIYLRLKDREMLFPMTATREVIPRPTVLEVPFTDFSAKAMWVDDDYKAVGQPIYQPPNVISREDGVVKED